jgi:CMP/dCMP kinase
MHDRTQKKDIISLGGKPGAGKSTVRYLMAEKLRWSAFSTGDFMRGIARERGITFDAFNAMVAEDKNFDLMIDAELMKIEAEQNEVVVDSHLAFHFIPSSFRVFFDISLEESARRIFGDRDRESRKSVGDVMESLEEARARIQARIDNHNDRYQRHYGINPYEPSQYDFFVNTEAHTPEEITDLVISAFKTWRVS